MWTLIRRHWTNWTRSPRLPWERAPGEGESAWAAFQAYLNLGPDRSIREAARIVRRASSTCAVWATRYHWVGRVAAWDSKIAHAEAVAAEKKAVSHAEAMARANVRIARYATGAALLATKRLLKRLVDKPDLTLGTTGTSELVAVAERAQRLAVGQAVTGEDQEAAAAVAALLESLRRVRQRTTAKVEAESQ